MCAPAAWLITMRAFRPPARQRSYSAVKSAAETAGGGLGQVGSPPCGDPFTTLALVGPGVAEGGGIEKSADTQLDRGARRVDPARLHRYPFPQQGGGHRWQGDGQVSRKRGPLPMNVNSRLDRGLLDIFNELVEIPHKYYLKH
jgi:hypothetical protein